MTSPSTNDHKALSRRDLLSRFGRIYARGEVVFREGDRGDEMYVVDHGRVRITKDAGDRTKVLTELGPGEFFGEMSIVTDSPRSATATVVDDTTLIVINASTLERMILDDTEIAVRMIRKLAERLAAANAQIKSLILCDQASSIAMELMARAGRDAPGQRTVRMQVDLVGLAEKTEMEVWEAEEVLENFRRARLVDIKYGGTLECDVVRLQEFRSYLRLKQMYGDFW